MRWRLASVPALGLALVSLLTAPAGASPAGRGWTSFEVVAGSRILAAASKDDPSAGELLTVVIEGDGDAHGRKGQPSADPTPHDPLGFRIAQAWPQGPVAWLGRPCQYVRDTACTPSDWTTGRYSEAAVAASSLAVDELKRRSGAARLRLVGWSGGGTMAALLAARRTDVAVLVTLASPLDLAAWTQWHGASPLAGSLDPADATLPPGIVQLHVLGRFDQVVPPALGEASARRLGGTVLVWREKHTCCWAKRTHRLLALAQPAR
ncbi:alpha/beta fold hydrolase [Phenylobacterium sp.]|uniref:alpha/beta fold hydrolase n=1 Tax=Phenylobacterium sp. TaxID=1871053 RepID=UPI002723D2A4|nr:hypothetical protein [Phenylobacterium sp.]MDO8801844.1 hypothetical protein [Phenylobacterium sp.]